MCQSKCNTNIIRAISFVLRKKGPMTGNISKAFYASHVFFEQKLRLTQRRPKSKKKVEVRGETVRGC